MRACWCCKNYNQLSWLERAVQRNISGRKVWYRRWAKHRCKLKQEDKYPNKCDFKEDIEKINMQNVFQYGQEVV